MKIAETDFQAWMGVVQARMEGVLARLLPAPGIAPARLHEAMRYASLEGGKRVRPLLAFAAGEVSGAAAERVEIAAAAATSSRSGAAPDTSPAANASSGRTRLPPSRAA